MLNATAPRRIARLPHPLADRLAGAPLDVVKLVAAILMVVDHTNTILFDGRYVWMWRLGRIAFPLFCFALACHVARGLDARKGVAILLLFAIPTQPIYAAAFPFGGNEASILFTLAAGATLAAALAAGVDPVRHAVLGLGALAVFLWPSRALSGVDFGLGGVLLPAALTLALLAPRRFAPWAIVLLLGLNAHTWRPAGEGPVEKALSDAFVAGFGFLAAVALAWTARGRPRFLPRYALHLFYPGHLAALALLRAAA